MPHPVDWIYLPTGATAKSLGVALHDAHLISIQSNLPSHELVLKFESLPYAEFHSLPENLRFDFHFAGVQSVRALRRPEDARRHLEESVSWNQLEETVTTDFEQYLDVKDAEIVSTPGEGVAFLLQGYFNHAVYHELFVRAERMYVTSEVEKINTLEALMALGLAFWAQERPLDK